MNEPNYDRFNWWGERILGVGLILLTLAFAIGMLKVFVYVCLFWWPW